MGSPQPSQRGSLVFSCESLDCRGRAPHSEAESTDPAVGLAGVPGTWQPAATASELQVCKGGCPQRAAAAATKPPELGSPIGSCRKA